MELSRYAGAVGYRRVIGPPNQEQLMPSAKKKSSKPTLCSACGGVDLIRKITTYPVLLTARWKVSGSTLAVLLSTNA